MRIAVRSGDGSLSPRYCAFQDVRRDVSGGGVRELAATLPSDVDGAGHIPRSRTVGATGPGKVGAQDQRVIQDYPGFELR